MRSETDIKKVKDALLEVVAVAKRHFNKPPDGILLTLAAASALEWVLELPESKTNHGSEGSFEDLIRTTILIGEEIKKTMSTKRT